MSRTEWIFCTILRVFLTLSENNAFKRQFTNLDRHYISEIGSVRCHWTFLLFFSRARKFVRWHSRDVATWSYSPTKGSFSLIRRAGVEKRWHSRLSRTQASKYFKSALQVKSKLQSLDCFFKIKAVSTVSGSFDKDCELGFYTEVWFDPPKCSG